MVVLVLLKILWAIAFTGEVVVVALPIMVIAHYRPPEELAEAEDQLKLTVHQIIPELHTATVSVAVWLLIQEQAV